MENNNPKNSHIECTVCQCAHHSCDGNFCSLDHIRIGTHEENPTMIQCTDCESFVLGDGHCCK